MAGNIHRRPDGKWRARYRDANHREHARHFPRKRDAERWLASQEVAIARGEWVDPTFSKITVGEWSRQWLALQVQLKPTTGFAYAHRALSLALTAAVRDGRLVRNGAEGVPLPRVIGKPKRFLTHDQVQPLEEACAPYGTLIKVLAYAGLRWARRWRGPLAGSTRSTGG
jgi:integrase